MQLELYGGGFKLALAQLVAFYYSAGFILHVLVPALLNVRSVQKNNRNKNDIMRDAVQSIGPLFVKAAVWEVCERLHEKGWGLLYASGTATWTLSHVAYMAVCVLLLDYLHDCWFYWTHRLLHWKPLYANVHYIHHRSTSPTAFTGYSFHLVEALIVFANEILVCFLFPIHLGLHRVYHLFTTVIHQGGHAGYEISPFLPHLSNLVALTLRGPRHGYRGFNTVRHHDMHHSHPRFHFSLYFTHWDRWCKTLHPGYDNLVALEPAPTSK